MVSVIVEVSVRTKTGRARAQSLEYSPMTEHAILQVLHEGRSLVAELSTSREGKRAWLGVYPLRLCSPDVIAFLRSHGHFDLESQEHVYNIRVFEIDRTLNTADVWCCEDD